MKTSCPLAIYIATSAGRNLHAYFLLRDRLVEAGHRVLDWTTLPEFPLDPDMPAELRRRESNRDAFGKVFAFCTESAAGADLTIYLGPSGQDAACEVSLAWAMGTRTFGLRGLFEAPGTILNRVVREWFVDPMSLLQAVERLAEEKAELGGNLG